MKKNTPGDVNLNEYKMIKNNADADDHDNLGVQSGGPIMSKEIEDLQKEVINLEVGEEPKDEEGDEMESMDDLKASILNHD